MIFRKLESDEKFHIVDYVKDYLQKHNDVEILIGGDSQNKAQRTVYAVVVALYHRGRGAHIVYSRWSVPREYSRPQRLLNEVWRCVEVAELLREAGLPKVTYIDIDLNPDPKYKSNEVFRQAVGLVEGMGYKVRYKTLGPIVSYAADYMVKG